MNLLSHLVIPEPSGCGLVSGMAARVNTADELVQRLAAAVRPYPQVRPRQHTGGGQRGAVGARALPRARPAYTPKWGGIRGRLRRATLRTNRLLLSLLTSQTVLLNIDWL